MGTLNPLLRFAKMRFFSLDFLIIVAYSARHCIVLMLHAVLTKWTSINWPYAAPRAWDSWNEGKASLAQGEFGAFDGIGHVEEGKRKPRFLIAGLEVL